MEGKKEKWDRGEREDRVRERFKVKLSERNIIKEEKTLNCLEE